MTSLTVHRPSGLLPTVARTHITRTVIDVQPGWLLLAAPAAAALTALTARRQRSAPPETAQVGQPDVVDLAASSPRRRPRIVVVSLTRLRRRPRPDATPGVEDDALARP